MKVSVVVTTYNLSQFIGDCLESVLQQSHPPHEIIIADDCSTDGTVEIAHRLGNNVLIVRQEKNCGALLNTLSGLKRATGEVVAFIDGDDTWPKDKLKRVAEEFSADPSVVLVTHGHRRVDADGSPTGKLDETHANISRILQIADSSLRQNRFRMSVLKREGIWFGSAYSIRRSKIDLDAFSRLLEERIDSANGYLDLVLAPYIVASNPLGKVVYLQDVVFDYRIHANNSASSKTFDKQKKAIDRGRATNAITKDLLSGLGMTSEVTDEYRWILLEYDFLERLYTRNYFSAAALLVKLAPFLLKRGRFMKECARFSLVIGLGPDIALRVK